MITAVWKDGNTNRTIIAFAEDTDSARQAAVNDATRRDKVVVQSIVERTPDIILVAPCVLTFWGN